MTIRSRVNVTACRLSPVIAGSAIVFVRGKRGWENDNELSCRLLALRNARADSSPYRIIEFPLSRFLAASPLRTAIDRCTLNSIANNARRGKKLNEARVLRKKEREREIHRLERILGKMQGRFHDAHDEETVVFFFFREQRQRGDPTAITLGMQQ